VSQVKGVEEGAIDDDAAFSALDWKLWNEGEMELSSAINEEFGKGVAGLSFVVEVELSDLGQGSVVVLYGGARRLEGERHRSRGEA
jgi:hypothetical protein